MKNRRFLVWAAVVAVLAGAIALAAGLVSSSSSSTEAPFSKFASDPDKGADKAGIANEGPSGTYEAQQEALRAYPADSVPLVATQNSVATFSSLKKKGKGPGSWQSIGPSQAKYPAVLDQFLAGGKEYTASGRVTAMALGGCKKNNKCSLYVGAAGGGIWTAKKVFDGGNEKWDFKSGLFLTNAIGSLLVDPSDPSGDTVYAGTGEPNASGDSEAGMGIFKSTNGGDSWTLVAGSDFFNGRAISSMALDGAGNLLVGVARAVRGVSSVTGGATSNPPPPAAPFGLYRQTGSTFTQIWNGAGSVRGPNKVAVDPNNPAVLYAAAFQVGIYRSLNNGGTWAQIKAPLNAGLNTDRAEFALNKVGSLTRMYVGIGNQSDAGANRARFYRTEDAAGAAVFTDMTTSQNIGYCTAQCWYDNYVVSPAGSPNVVYLGGSFSYGEVHGSSNGRSVLQSIDGGATWSDMTIDSNNDGWIHPDQHALVTAPDDPLQFIAGDDGGVVRSNGKYVDASSDCDSRVGLDATGIARCKSLLSRIPDRMAVLNKGLVTLQFQSLSYDPKHPKNGLMGGTQDNGTFEYKGSSDVWPQIIYGDGGQSGWNAADSNLRFNTFTGQANDVNFRNGDPVYWVVATGPIVSSPEGAQFYPPIIADPNPTVAGSIFQGSQSVWRTQDWGGNQAFLEANCPEFTTSAADPACGDFVQIGPPGSTDLTSPAYGDRPFGTVGAIERVQSNTGTMWVATTTGRVFITDNANAAAASVSWTRLDTSSTVDPQRFVSSIYIDPANPNHAWISYSGYNFNTPGLPGHVFEVTRTGATATWVDRTYDLADLPVTDLVRDDLTGDVYAATDFGVMKLANGATSWTIAATGMPMVEVPGLTIVPGERILYAATHGLGAWKLELPKVKA